MIVRKQFPLLLSDEERQLFETYAKMKGWTISKSIRIVGRAFINAEINKLNFPESLSKAIMADGEGK